MEKNRVRRAVGLAVRVISAALVLTAASVQAAPRSPVLVGLASGSGFDVVGAYSPAHGYLQSVAANGLFRSGQRFSLWDIGGRRESVVIGKITRDDRLPDNFFAPILRRAQNAPQRLALLSTHNPMPRRVVRISPRQRVYRRAVSQMLREGGLRVLSPKVTSALRVDLNGDGRNEVLLTARSSDNMGTQAFARRGHYALVMARFLVRGKVQTQPLGSDVYTKDALGGAVAATDFSVLSCADIDGDGKMEIAVTSRYYEGYGVEIYKFDGRRFVRVLNFGAGA